MSAVPFVCAARYDLEPDSDLPASVLFGNGASTLYTIPTTVKIFAERFGTVFCTKSRGYGGR